MYLLLALCSESHSVIFDSMQFHGLYCPQNSPGQNTGVNSLSLLQGIFPIEGSNPGLPHGRLLLVDPKGTPLLILSTHKNRINGNIIYQKMIITMIKNGQWITVFICFIGGFFPTKKKKNKVDNQSPKIFYLILFVEWLRSSQNNPFEHLA